MTEGPRPQRATGVSQPPAKGAHKNRAQCAARVCRALWPDGVGTILATVPATPVQARCHVGTQPGAAAPGRTHVCGYPVARSSVSDGTWPAYSSMAWLPVNVRV